MDKYTLLIILNLPFVIFGLIKAIVTYKQNTIPRLGLVLRICFWLLILSGLVFAKQGYHWLIQHHLTDSTPLSIADVLLVTGVLLCLILITRLYAKLDMMDRRFTDLHEKLSIHKSSRK